MQLGNVLLLTQAQLFLPEQEIIVLDKEIRLGGSADLMSDVLRYDLSQGLLITGLNNLQIVRTAEMADVAAILLVREKTPGKETIALAKQVGIPILGTPMTMFEACGRLYAAGLAAAQRRPNKIT